MVTRETDFAYMFSWFIYFLYVRDRIMLNAFQLFTKDICSLRGIQRLRYVLSFFLHTCELSIGTWLFRHTLSLLNISKLVRTWSVLRLPEDHGRSLKYQSSPAIHIRTVALWWHSNRMPISTTPICVYRTLSCSHFVRCWYVNMRRKPAMYNFVNMEMEISDLPRVTITTVSISCLDKGTPRLSPPCAL